MRRVLKVYYNTQRHRDCREVTNPQIMLTGKWLKSLGFEIGNSITLNCERGKIVIENNDMESVINAEPQTVLF